MAIMASVYVVLVQLFVLVVKAPGSAERFRERRFLEQQLLAEPFPAPPFSSPLPGSHDADCDFPRLHFEVNHSDTHTVTQTQ